MPVVLLSACQEVLQGVMLLVYLVGENQLNEQDQVGAGDEENSLYLHTGLLSHTSLWFSHPPGKDPVQF